MVITLAKHQTLTHNLIIQKVSQMHVLNEFDDDEMRDTH